MSNFNPGDEHVFESRNPRTALGHLANEDVDGLIRKFDKPRSVAASPESKRAIEVKMAGSGDSVDRRTMEGRGDPDLVLKRGDNPEYPFSISHYVAEAQDGTQHLVTSGPGAPGTKDGADVLGGASDSGSNSIKNLVEQTPGLIKETADKLRDADNPFVNLGIESHSRGSVASSQVANRHKTDNPADKVNLVMFDPVPGPLHKGEDVSVNISGLDESTVVYSVASGYMMGFTPQIVRGAKRIIITKRKHEAGFVDGFVYEGARLVGGALNRLPDGVYAHADGDQLVPVASIDEVHAAWAEAFAKGEARVRDVGLSGRDREKIVVGAMATWFRDRAEAILGEVKIGAISDVTLLEIDEVD
ncbi:hypothetical protein [Actinophytocola sp. NPDC049390]|uniref:hypothetical protein n=1 Tax=Actinophytocola sp. NPDC049390 TaxID=3363894 RepID=UPI00378C83C4